MQSSDNHINSPMKRVDIDLNEVPQPSTQYVTQDFYDLMGTHDPGTLYVIIDSKDTRIYMGDWLLPSETRSSAPKYFIGITEDGKYGVYEALWGSDGRAYIIYKARYDDPQTALKMLDQYKNSGSSDELSLKIHVVLGSYITRENGINETILNIIALMGFRDHQYLQYLIERSIYYGVNPTDRDLPPIMRANLRKENGSPSLVKLYADIYDVFVLYDFFKAVKYKDIEVDQMDLSEPIQRIISCNGLL